MTTVQTSTLQVPGATLFYKLQGKGPLLLIIQGGDGTADSSGQMVSYLAEHFNVLTYDRRGLSRSTLGDASEKIILETHSEDVYRLLKALASEPAFILGSSIGGLIGLDLLSRHPEVVQTLLAHEPATAEPLPEAERTAAQNQQQGIFETFQQDGVMAAMQKFMVLADINFDDREPEVILPAPSPERIPNVSFFLSHDVPAVNDYRLRWDALKASASKLTVLGGQTNPSRWVRRSADALAELLGVRFVEMIGGHNGFVTHPKAFAAQVTDLFNAG